MRIYKTTYKDREGKLRKSAKWYLDFADHSQLRHKIPAFADKRLSEALGRNVESLVNCRVAGLEPDAKLNVSDRVFVSSRKSINTAELIRKDLRVAEVELTDRECNAICFHSLRNSYVSFLANSRTPR
jgi:hypothetical protein